MTEQLNMSCVAGATKSSAVFTSGTQLYDYLKALASRTLTAAQHAVPTIYTFPEFAVAGGVDKLHGRRILRGTGVLATIAPNYLLPGGATHEERDESRGLFGNKQKGAKRVARGGGMSALCAKF
jgi:hypothetical protein